MEKKKRPTVSDASAPDTAKHTASPTKQSRILRLLADGESLNRFEAERIGDHTLPSTISTLRHYHGLPIVSAREKVPNRFGTLTPCKRYHLPADARPLALALLAQWEAA
jgi:hypothetical protein